jgi:hypothetical protein
MKQVRPDQPHEEYDDEWELDDDEESEELDISQEADLRRTWQIEKSIKAIADRAGFGLLEKPRGPRPQRTLATT